MREKASKKTVNYLILLAFITLLCFPNFLFAEAKFYHQKVAKQELSDWHHQMVEKIRHNFGLSSVKLPKLSMSLLAAAQSEALVLSEISKDKLQRQSGRDIRKTLSKSGVTDYLIKAAFRTGKTPEEVRDALLSWVKNSTRGGWNTFGIGLSQKIKMSLGVVILASTKVMLDPVPMRVKPGTEIIISGRTIPGIRNLQLFLTNPRGKVKKERLMRVASGGFSHTVSLKKSGLYKIELLVDEGEGPRVANLFNVASGRVKIFHDTPELSISKNPSKQEVQKSVLLWMNLLRKQHELPRLKLNSKLSEIEEQAILGMSSNSPLLHRDKSGLDPGKRLKKAGLSPDLFGENLGRNKSLKNLVNEIAESPSHRQNLLASHFNSVGIAVNFDEKSGTWTVGQLFAALSETHHYEVHKMIAPSIDFWEKVHVKRAKKGCKPLSLRWELMSVAKHAMAKYIKNGKLDGENMKRYLNKKNRQNVNSPVELISIYDAANYEDLSSFSGFSQTRWTMVGLAMATQTNGRIVALILLGSGSIQKR